MANFGMFFPDAGSTTLLRFAVTAVLILAWHLPTTFFLPGQAAASAAD